MSGSLRRDKGIQQAKTKASNSESQLRTYKAKAEKYGEALNDFYLDNAVIVIEGDSKYYHRYGCPDTAMGRGGEYRYNVYNVELAQHYGHSKCPTCFGVGGSSYMDKYY